MALTRRFFNTILDASHTIVHCAMAPLARDAVKGTLFTQLLDMLRFYAGFEIDDITGQEQTDSDISRRHYEQVQSLQRTAFQHYPELREFALSSAGSVDSRDALLKHFSDLRFGRDLAIKVFPPAAFSQSDFYFYWLRPGQSPIDRSVQQLWELTAKLFLTALPKADAQVAYTKEFLLELVVYHFEHRLSQLDALNEMALYPNEQV